MVWRRILLQPVSGAAGGPGESVNQREPPGVLSPDWHAAVTRSADLRGRRQPATVSHRADHRGRALRDPVHLRARQGRRRQCAARLRSLEERDRSRRVHAARRNHFRRFVCRRRQCRRSAAGADQPERAELARRADRSGASGRDQLDRRAAGTFGPASNRDDRRGQAVCDVSRGRRDTRLRPRPGRQLRERSVPARARRGRRLRRLPRRHVSLLHVQLAERSADHLRIRHRDGHERRIPALGGPWLRLPSGSKRRRSSTRAATAPACRCSWSTARA